MTFFITAKDGQSYLVHTEVSADTTTRVVVQPVTPQAPTKDTP